jgi:hypothetical protein
MQEERRESDGVREGKIELELVGEGGADSSFSLDEENVREEQQGN